MRNSNRGGCGSPLWNFGTLMFLGLAVLFFFWVIMVALDTNATLGGVALNPFPPKEVVVNTQPTITAVPTLFFPTSAATDVPAPTSEDGQSPTATVDVVVTTAAPTDPVATTTPLATQTEWVSGPTDTPAPTFDELWFDLMAGMPLYQPYETCDSMWVGGAITDAEGAPYMNVIIMLTGQFGEEATFPGTATQYGESGYEFDLGTAGPTSGNVFLQIIDEVTENTISDLIPVSTKSNCDENFIMVNWVQSEKP